MFAGRDDTPPDVDVHQFVTRVLAGWLPLS
jgi:hypothetical protein